MKRTAATTSLAVYTANVYILNMTVLQQKGYQLVVSSINSLSIGSNMNTETK